MYFKVNNGIFYYLGAKKHEGQETSLVWVIQIGIKLKGLK